MIKSHILLTGGTGFFGKALLRHWIEMERKGQNVATVTLLSRDPDRFATQNPTLVAHSWLHLTKGDICEAVSLPTCQAFTHVLHAAADSTGGPMLKPQQRFDQIVSGTRNVLELALTCGAKRFLLTSSGGVYGTQPSGVDKISEDCLTFPDPLNPANTYSVAKRMAEHLCALNSHAHGLECVVARCFAFVGPDLPLNVHFAIGNFIRDALWAKEIVVNGDGTPLRTYLDQRDLAVWLTRLLADGISGQAYNVGSDEVVSISELAYLVRDLVSPKKPVRILGAPQVNKDRNRYVPDIAKIYEHLNLSPTFSLAQSILETAKTAQSKGKEACLAA